MSVYRTNDGDMVDAICRDHYGSERHTSAVYDANPNLAELGSVLPRGIEITLPDIQTDPVQSPIRLWS